MASSQLDKRLGEGKHPPGLRYLQEGHKSSLGGVTPADKFTFNFGFESAPPCAGGGESQGDREPQGGNFTGDHKRQGGGGGIFTGDRWPPKDHI